MNFGIFYSSLSPHGEWIECDLGYVWRPVRVAHGWRPYLYGRWVWTDYGWYWVSSEPFGWATFHYGRWYYDDYYGWIWIPDEVWGPAWVEWRYDDDYVGWAPLSPYATFSFSVGITFTNTWVSPIHYWSFVPCRNFTTARVVDYVQPVERSRRIFGNTRGTVNIRAEGERIVNTGVDVNVIERRTNSRINRVEITHNERTGGERIVREATRERIEVYRPRLDGQTREEGTRPQQFRRGEQPIHIGNEKSNRGAWEDQTKQRRFEKENNNLPEHSRGSRRDNFRIEKEQKSKRRFEIQQPPERKPIRERWQEQDRREKTGQQEQVRGQKQQEQRSRGRRPF